jgi:hypothetical protein
MIDTAASGLLLSVRFMADERSPDTIETVARKLLARYGEHAAALIAYGSRAFGQARRGSAFDFWLIVRDAEAFHRANAEFYRTRLNLPSTPEEQIRLNRAGPLFYALKEEGVEVKLAVLDERSLAEFCVADWWTVKGRMQKPLRMFRSTPAVDRAILSARREGLACALNLVPREFTTEQLLREIVGLSYRAEVRPEHKSAKVRSILEAGRAELERIYLPLLGELPYVEARGPFDGIQGRPEQSRRGSEGWLDRRGAEERARARAAILRALRRSKWCRQSLRFIWRNYRSYANPLRYILLKIVGEVEKSFGRRKNGDRRADH